MLNNSGPRYKRSSLEKKMNNDVIWCVGILLFLCFLGSLGARFWLDSFKDYRIIPYIIASSNVTFESWLTFWTFIIILQVNITINYPLMCHCFMRTLQLKYAVIKCLKILLCKLHSMTLIIIILLCFIFR